MPESGTDERTYRPGTVEPRRSTLKIVFVWLFLTALVLSPFLYRTIRFWGLHEIGEPFDVAAFATVDLAPEDNALEDYEIAQSMLIPLPKIPGRNLDDELGDALEKSWPEVPDEIQQWLLDNRPALERWKRGTEKTDLLHVQPGSVDLYTDHSSVDQLRTFSRLVLIEVSRLLSEDRPDGAWPWCEALLRCSRHAGRHGGIIPRLTGCSVFVHGSLATLNVAEHPETSAELLGEMLVAAQEIYDLTEPNSTWVKCEYLSLRNTMNGALFISPLESKNKLSRWGVYWFTGEPHISHVVSRQYFTNWLEQVELHYRERQPIVGKLNMFGLDSKKTYDTKILRPAEIETFGKRTILFNFLSPALAQADIAMHREKSRQFALEVCLALRIYHKRHNIYPDDLDELVTAGILDEIPVDPFSRNGDSMKYRRDGETVTVWTVGEDEVDDGGFIVYSEERGQNTDYGFSLGNKPMESETSEPAE